MRKVLAVWFCLLFLLVPSMVLAGEKVVVEEKEVEKQPLRFISDLDAPPFAFVENFKNVGFEIDLGEALGKELGRPVKWIKQSFNIPSFSSTLNVGRADAVLCSLTVTEKRRQYFDFTIPYFRTNLAVATPRDVDWDKQAFKNGLSHKIRVGVMRRTTAEEWARKNLKATRKTYSSPERLARALKNREVGIILIDKPILMWTMANRHYKFKIVEEGLDHQDYAIAVSKSNQELLEELNTALKKLDADGVYDRIYEKWYDISQDLPKLGR
ncbi:MAG: ABC transporter substrate-binding protein [Candidatus Auribacterota bacterium]|nr:ABC transporter substrate-binding protein [Candidatus Auribacterota bacterium]